MKRIFASAFGLFISALAFSQASLKLTSGQKIIIETSSDIQASLPMGMELTSTTTSTNSLEVKSATATNYIIGNALTRMKVNMNMMGQANAYNSENKEGNNEDMAKIFDEKLNKQVNVIVDSKNGTSTLEKKSEKKAGDSEDMDPTALMKMFADNSEEGVVAGAFELVPAGKAIGDSWSETTNDKDVKTTSTYTLKSITGNEAVIQTVVVATSKTTLNFQEMEFEVKSETKTNGEIITDISTGLVKKRTSVADITGSIQMMGQDTPISAKATTSSVYN